MEGDSHMADLYALAYVSTASRPVSSVEIDGLLARAQMRNAKEKLTGMLLFDGGHFMQYVEGPAEGMGRVYRTIQASGMHHGIIELMREPITEREFPQWSMAFRSVNDFGMSHPTQQSELLAPTSGQLSAARMLLMKFWNRGRFAQAF
jgi:hypothetical protein